MGEAQPLIFDIEEESLESIDDLLQDSPKTEETDVETDNEDEVKVIPTLVSPYTYINDQLRKTEDHQDIITLNPDFDELGVYRLANTTFRSHVHYCLGAVLYMGKSFVMWIDWPLALVKNIQGRTRQKGRTGISMLRDPTHTFMMTMALTSALVQESRS